MWAYSFQASIFFPSEQSVIWPYVLSHSCEITYLELHNSHISIYLYDLSRDFVIGDKQFFAGFERNTGLQQKASLLLHQLSQLGLPAGKLYSAAPSIFILNSNVPYTASMTVL